MSWVTTSTLLRDLRDYANDAAWERFVGRFREPLVRFAASQGVPDVHVEDVVQETLAAFAETLRVGRYDRDAGRLSSWLFGIAWKQILRQHERGRRRERAVGDGADVERAMPRAQDARRANDAWTMHWERFIAQTCLEQVRREFRADAVRAFELIVREECTPAEAAERVGLPVKSVYNAKHRILTRMRELRTELEETI